MIKIKNMIKSGEIFYTVLTPILAPLNPDNKLENTPAPG